MTTLDLKTQIERSIMSFSQGNFRENGIRLLKSLGYASDRQVIIEPNTFAGFVDIHPPLAKMNKQKALVDKWLSVDILFQLTGDDLKQMTQGHLIFDKSRIDNQIIESYLFLAIELIPGDYSRTKLADVTREVNKFFAMPVMILFKYGDLLTLSIINRRLHKRDELKDVLEKVTLIKGINIKNPIRAHVEILFDLSLSELEKAGEMHSFVELHKAWQKALDTSVLNKKFYREIADWYFYAVENVEFPAGIIPDRQTRNATNIIRLITRLIFVWFIKEKGLVPNALFDPNQLKEILYFNDPQNSTYYKAILQNLFFATLNTEMGPERRFRGMNKNSNGLDAHFGISTVYRYEDYFIDPQKGLNLFSGIPFLNGGLFECLDKRDEKILVDGFSDDPRNQPIIPDSLFFGDDLTVDMSEVYGDKHHNQEKVRGLIRIFNSYKFTIEENTPLDEEVALDPELLGKVFENLLASYNPETGNTARKQTGSFYTPREIVNYMVDESLIAYLENSLQTEELADSDESVLESKLRHLLAYNNEPHQFSKSETDQIISAIDKVKVLDPACGSGAFPMGILHKLVFILKKLDSDNNLWRDVQLKKAILETEKVYKIGNKEERQQRLIDINEAFENNASDYGRKLFLIENCIYGVDLQPIAVQIAKLRFFISLVVDQTVDRNKSNLGIRPLPNLESKFVAANTLIGIEKAKQLSLHNPQIDEKEQQLSEVRDSLFTARTQKTKHKYRELDKQLRTEITTLLEKDGWSNTIAAQLSSWDPFSQNASADFFDPEWMFGVGNGFNIVLGNPPYIQLQTMHEKVDILQKQGFQTFAKTGDLYCLFYEKGIQLLHEKGILTFITSNKWMRAGYGETLRDYFAERTNPLVLVDFSGQKIFESATVDVNILIIEKARNKNSTKSCVITDASNINNLSVFIEQHQTINEFKTKQSWIILQDIEQRIKKKIEEVGVPLKEWNISMNRGILTGYNEAFIITGKKRNELIAEDPKSAEIIRPILRGRDIKRYGYDFADMWLINTHNGLPTKNLPRIDVNNYPAVKAHLDNYYDLLAKRFDKGDTPYNLRSCIYWDDFYKQKIIYAETMRVHKRTDRDRFPRFSFSIEELFLDKTCFMITGKDLDYILPIINSELISFFIRSSIAVMDIGGFLMQKIYIENLPIPHIKNDLHSKIVSLSKEVIERRKQANNCTEIEKEIDLLVYDIFGLTTDEINYIESL